MTGATKNRAADFASDIFLKVSVCSDVDFNLSTSNIKQKLSPGGISVVLLIDILLKKPAQCLKTKAEKRVALFYYIYAFINK